MDIGTTDHVTHIKTHFVTFHKLNLFMLDYQMIHVLHTVNHLYCDLVHMVPKDEINFKTKRIYLMKSLPGYN